MVTSADGTKIAVDSTGPPGAPTVVLLHGWAASAAAWSLPAGDDLHVLAVDLRGHGASDTPVDGYRDSGVLAGDVAAVLSTLAGPVVLVGWSYGGLVITDYLRRYGTAGIAGVMFVGAITEIGRDRAGGRVGSAMRAALPDALSEDPHLAVPALLELAVLSTSAPRSGTEVQRGLAASLRVPPAVRAALFRRDVTSAEVLSAVDVPTLFVHGTDDVVVSPLATEYAAGLVPGAEVRWYPDTGHMPFAERPERFRTDLAAFAHRCLVDSAGVGT
ncbi:MAG: alpha/beta hydrolase [Kutzneria sp.]|nr:alpha/beta hydrolase [Kutzneria sp.]